MWLAKWGIKWQDFPNPKEEIKKWVLEKFRATMWKRRLVKKNLYMLEISTRHGIMMRRYIWVPK